MRGSLLGWPVQIFGQIRQDDLVERLLADGRAAEDGTALGAGAEDRRGARRRVASGRRSRGRDSRRALRNGLSGGCRLRATRTGGFQVGENEIGQRGGHSL